MQIPITGLTQLSKSLISIRGPDATKFLNGLLTSRLLPNVVKKKQHTISDAELKHANLQDIIDINTNYGLMHEDIYDPNFNITISRDGINSMILNSKGRVFTDCFLYSEPFHNLNGEFNSLMDEPGYLLEVDKDNVSQVMMMLKLHKLSAKVDIKPDLKFKSFYYYNDTTEFDEWLEEVQETYFKSIDPVNALQNANSFIANDIIFNKNISNHIFGFAIDNRIPNYGFKFVLDKTIDKEKLFSSSFQNSFKINEIPEKILKYRRFQNGVFEYNDASKGESLLPFECNLDYTNGLSLDKGCYVGQELTIRTYNNGIIRKRVYPLEFFQIEKEVEDLSNIPITTLSKLDLSPLEDQQEQNTNESTPVNNPFGTSSKPVRKRKSSSGKILSICDNLGLALLSISDVNKSPLFKIEVPTIDGNKLIGAKVTVPDWWPE
ncbi:CAF17 [Candida pseudojiufengensis]|uniref:CAF17 n=1 Tax=Candida pseudojiufengensis TaxID=497109 RepID=UPI00222513B4|nr:CAF17 [Candida pseudojiufengensis]KAI5966581.1 CAF17 [Candida pseudojiufengensis]